MPHARRTDPTTSFQAAASVKNVTETQKNILLLLSMPMTDDQLIDAFYQFADANGWKKASPSGIRSRRAELVAAGLVKDTGERAKSWSGRQSIVWRVA